MFSRESRQAENEGEEKRGRGGDWRGIQNHRLEEELIGKAMGRGGRLDA